MQLSGNLVTLYLFQAAAGRLYPIPLGTLSPMRGRLADGAAAPDSSGQNLLPFGADPTEGSLSSSQKAVGASIPKDTGTY